MEPRPRITQESFLDVLAHLAPETGSVVAEHLRDNGELLPHLLLADLQRFTVKVFALGESSSAIRIFHFIEVVFTSGDAYLQNAVAVSFVEDFGAFPGETPDLLALWPQVLRDERERQRRHPA